MFFDEPSLAFDFDSNGWKPNDDDAYFQQADLAYTKPASQAYVSRGSIGAGPDGLGQSACPECAYLSEGRCNWCSDETKDYPECLDCVQTADGRSIRKTAWYKRADIVTPVLTGVAVTVTATIITTIVMRRLDLKRA